MVPWVLGGEIRHREHIVAGLENAADAFPMLFDGRNEGKLIVEI
jgi:NADPH-dependent curcumin reductase CurA